MTLAHDPAWWSNFEQRSRAVPSLPDDTKPSPSAAPSEPPTNVREVIARAKARFRATEGYSLGDARDYFTYDELSILQAAGHRVPLAEVVRLVIETPEQETVRMTERAADLLHVFAFVARTAPAALRAILDAAQGGAR